MWRLSFLRPTSRRCFVFYYGTRRTMMMYTPFWKRTLSGNFQYGSSILIEEYRDYHTSTLASSGVDVAMIDGPILHLPSASTLEDHLDDEGKEDSGDDEELSLEVMEEEDSDESHPNDPSSPAVETHSERRKRLHAEALMQSTPTALMHEAQRLTHLPSSIYRQSYRSKVGPPASAESVSFPLFFHAVRVLQALSHPRMFHQTDAAHRRNLLQHRILPLIDRLVQEEADCAAAFRTTTTPRNVHEKNVLSLERTSRRMAYILLRPSSILNRVVLRWKELSLRNETSAAGTTAATSPLLSPKELLAQLQSWSSRLAASSSAIQLYDMIVINMIMEVIVKQQPDPMQAPIVAEGLLQFLLTQQDDDDDENGTKRLQPDSFTYSLMLSTWAQSKLPQAGARMEALIREMKEQHGVTPSAVNYHILLRHYATMGNLERLQAVLQQYKIDVTETHGDYDVALVRSELVFCYCKVGHWTEASDTLYQMLQEDLTPQARELTIQSIFNVLSSYRDAILSPGSSREVIQHYISAAEQLVRDVSQHDGIMCAAAAAVVTERMNNSLTFIYAGAGRLDVVQSMFDNETQPSYMRYMALVEAYGERRMPEQAMKVLHRLLEDRNIVFNSHIFGSVIDAWDNASHPHALEKALEIIALLEEHPRCRELQIQPAQGVFNNLLQILSNATTATSTTVTTTVPSFLDDRALQYAIVAPKNAPDDPLEALKSSPDGSPRRVASFDTCRLSIAILDEMERRYKTFSGGKPTTITYSIIIKTCFRANHIELADQIMTRMESSDTPPDIRTYNNILSHYATLKSTTGAEQAEKILLYLREHAREKPSLRPDIISYSIVLKAWSNSGDPQALDHMWNLYELLRSEGIEMDVIFGSHLILCLSLRSATSFTFAQPVDMGVSASSSPLMQRARKILEEMEENKNMAKKPELRAYKSLLDGYIRSHDLVAATSLVLHMVEMYTSGKNPHAKPTEYIFLQVIKSWLNHGDLIKATMFANKMRELFLQGQIPMGPGVSCYKVLHAAWLRSMHPKREWFLANMASHLEDMTHNRTSTKSSDWRASSPASSASAPTFLDVANAAAAAQQ